MNIFEKICVAAEALENQLIAIRRDFHLHAERGWFEMRTTSLIARYLKDLGYEVLTGEAVCKKDARMGVPSQEDLDAHYAQALTAGADPEFLPATKGGMTGVIGILRCGEGPTVAMRFDIDALDVSESGEDSHLPVKLGFSSCALGAMHACGHDGHAAIGMGVANVLMQIKDQLHGTVKLIFQPAEEGVCGAKSIVENGHLDDVQFFLGSHITGKKADDPAAIIPGSYGALATSKFDVTYGGLSAHAGSVPHTGRNALQAAASAVLNLYAIPRHGGGASRINVGTLVAGSGRNVIADKAVMKIEVRGETTQINRYMYEQAEKIIKNTADMYGCSCQIVHTGSADSLESDLDLAQRLQDVCRDKLNLPVSDKLSIPSFGSEDISYMMNRVQELGGKATFLRVMAVTAGPAHNPLFDFDEACIVNGVKAFCGAAADIMA